jgi:hypothetical protein
MPVAVKLREDFSAQELRAYARRSKDVNQSRRLLSLAAVRDGKDRGEAAKVGGTDRQTLRDWVHRFNAAGSEGLLDNWTDGPKSRLSTEQLAVGRVCDDRRSLPGSRARCSQKHHPDPVAVSGAGAELRRKYLAIPAQNWLSNRVFENHDAIIDAACDAGEGASPNRKRSP